MTVSFEILTNENLPLLKRKVYKELPLALAEDIEEIFLELSENSEDGCEYALSWYSGCLLVRIYDGEYLFSYPISLEDGADEVEALNEIRRYAVKEEIPLVICDIPKEKLAAAISLFRHLSVDAADAEGDYYTARPVSELSLIGEIPYGNDGDIELSALRSEDVEKYAALCRDVETNRYWGYNYREDYPDADDEHFMKTANEELDRGVALALAVRYRGDFCGEVVLYSFDLQGAAQCAVRILPGFRRKGLAKAALEILSEIAAGMGLLYMSATVDKENIPSVKMCSAFFNTQIAEGKNIVFSRKL